MKLVRKFSFGSILLTSVFVLASLGSQPNASQPRQTWSS